MRKLVLRSLITFSIASSFACGLSGSSRERGQTQQQPQTQIEISPGGNEPGGTVVTQGGRNVWPPSGPGCDRYVACCDAASATSSATRLMCQLTAAGSDFTCQTGIETIRQYLRESNTPIPPACNP
jgi:hypothetical protein